MQMDEEERKQKLDEMRNNVRKIEEMKERSRSKTPEKTSKGDY
jgi:hypothetical protein